MDGLEGRKEIVDVEGAAVEDESPMVLELGNVDVESFGGADVVTLVAVVTLHEGSMGGESQLQTSDPSPLTEHVPQPRPAMVQASSHFSVSHIRSL